VHAKFSGQFRERQQLFLSTVMNDHIAGSPKHHGRDTSTSTVPGAQCLEGG